MQFSEGDGWLLRNYWRGKGDYSKFELFEPTHSAGQKEQGRIIFVHSWIYLDYAEWRALKMLPWFPVGRQDHPNTINFQIHLINPQITYKSSSRSLRHPWSQTQSTKSKQSSGNLVEEVHVTHYLVANEICEKLQTWPHHCLRMFGLSRQQCSQFSLISSTRNQRFMEWLRLKGCPQGASCVLGCSHRIWSCHWAPNGKSLAPYLHPPFPHFGN